MIIQETSAVIQTYFPVLRNNEEVTHLLSASRPEHTYEKDSGDRWGDIVGDLLDVEEELTSLKVLDDGNPHNTDQHQQQNEQSGNIDRKS